MTDELKPCPFCGGTKLHVESYYMSNRKYVECENPDCESAGPVDLGESGAVEKWNRRIPEPPVQWIGIPEQALP